MQTVVRYKKMRTASYLKLSLDKTTNGNPEVKFLITKASKVQGFVVLGGSESLD